MFCFLLCIQTRELLTRFSSTVFACDISGDTRYIRCDFPQCREHAEALQGRLIQISKLYLKITGINVAQIIVHITSETWFM